MVAFDYITIHSHIDFFFVPRGQLNLCHASLMEHFRLLCFSSYLIYYDSWFVDPAMLKKLESFSASYLIRVSFKL